MRQVPDKAARLGSEFPNEQTVFRERAPADVPRSPLSEMASAISLFDLTRC